MNARRRPSAKSRKAGKLKPTHPARGRAARKQPCFCYIVQCRDGSFYTGWAVDAERRVQAHNAGRGARYTRSRRPVKLVYVEPQPDRATAMKRERAIKKLTRARKLTLMTQSTSRARPLLQGMETPDPDP